MVKVETETAELAQGDGSSAMGVGAATVRAASVSRATAGAATTTAATAARDTPRVRDAAGSPRGRPHLVSLLQMDTSAKRVLIVDGPGLYLGKHSERLRVTQHKEVLQEAPLLDLEHVLIVGRGVSVSSDVLLLLAEHGIAFDVLSDREEPQASLIPSALGATVKTRRQQLTAFGDARGAALARGFAGGKLVNQARLLRYLAKNRRDSMPHAHQGAGSAALLIEGLARQIGRLGGANADAVRQEILTLEGRAGEFYWHAARNLLLAPVEWEHRETRGAQDPVNSALNYGYKILYTHVQRAIVLAGLDPHGGYLHVDRPGRPSLVLDMVEEFRQTIVDRCIFALFNQGTHMDLEDGWLTQASRRAIVDRLRERLEGTEPYEAKRHAMRIIVQNQARRLASHLRGERPDYRPYVGRW